MRAFEILYDGEERYRHRVDLHPPVVQQGESYVQLDSEEDKETTVDIDGWLRVWTQADAVIASVDGALDDLDALDPEERTQAEYLFREFFWSWANLWIKVDRGDFLTFKVDFDSVAFEIESHVRRKGIQRWWLEPENRALYFPGFAKIVDQMIHENPVHAKKPLPSV